MVHSYSSLVAKENYEKLKDDEIRNRKPEF